MSIFQPFRGTRYNRAHVRTENVVSPPYDVISNEYRDELYARDPHNVIRLELSRETDPYASASELFRKWHEEHILVVDDQPSFYVYYQIFDTPNGKRVTREGVIGRLKLSPYSEKKVLPHERTLAAPKKDRLQLMEATEANLSPIFGLISDPSLIFDQTLEIATVQGAIADVDEVLPTGVHIRHILWRLDDPMAVERIRKIVSRDTVIIADGHHRYETAVRYHELHPDVAGSDHIMIFITNLQAAGAVILPTHRVLHSVANFNQFTLLAGLRETFEVIPFENREEALAAFERDTKAITLIEFTDDPLWALVRDEAPQRPGTPLSQLPVVRLQEEILKPLVGLTQQDIDNKTNLLYPHTIEELDQLKESQPTDAAFLLRPVTSAELAAVVEQGEFMPQKSTFFYPKLLTGLVFHEFEAQTAPSEAA